MKTGMNKIKKENKYTNKTLQRDGDHGVNAIDSSVQNREGIDFLKVLSNDAVSGQVSLVGWLVEEKGMCHFNIKSNFLLSRREIKVENVVFVVIVVVLFCFLNTHRRDEVRGV